MPTLQTTVSVSVPGMIYPTATPQGPIGQRHLVEFGGMPGDPELNISDNTRLVMARILDTANGTIYENGTGSPTVTTTTDNAFGMTAKPMEPFYTGINSPLP